VRSLYDDGAGKPQDAMRDYVLLLDDAQAPLLTVYGGKITTYRRLAEAALERLAPVLGARPAWTRKSRLPGGDFPVDGVAQLVAQTRRSWPFMSETHVRRLVQAYGTRVSRILGAARQAEDLGPRLGADLTGAEVRYLMEHEWARTADDVLWRRSKLGLRVSSQEHEQLAKFMADAIGSSG
jgi:glycerol-3-phosphate dehydrogenase